jgi:hypothetical protein
VLTSLLTTGILLSNLAFSPGEAGRLAGVAAALTAKPVSTAVVSPWTLRVGQMRLTLESGRAGNLPGTAGPSGFFFSGKGRFSLACRDANAFQALDFNLGLIGGVKVQGEGGGRTLDLPVEQVRLFATALDVPAFAGPVQDGLLAEFQGFTRSFAYPPAPHPVQALAWSTANLPGARTLVLELVSGGARFRYTLLEGHPGTETLVALRPGLGALPASTRAIRLVHQTLAGAAQEAPLPEAFLREVQVSLVAEGTLATVQAEETLQVTLPTRILRLRLLSAVEGPLGGSSLRRFENRVLFVQDASGKDLPFVHEGGQLLVELPAILPAEQRVQLRIRSQGELLQKWSRSSCWAIGEEPWFPMAAGGNLFTGKVRVEVPAADVPVAVGNQVRRETKAGRTVLETVLEIPAASIPVTAGAYTLTEKKIGGLTLRHAGRVSHRTHSNDLLTQYGAMAAFYQRQFGGWPFKELTWVDGTPLQPVPSWVFAGPEGWMAFDEEGGTSRSYQADASAAGPATALDEVGTHDLDYRMDPVAAGPGTSLEAAGWTYLTRSLDLNSACSLQELLSQKVRDGILKPGAGRQAHPVWANHARATQVARQLFGQFLRPMSEEDAWLFQGLAAYNAALLIKSASDGERNWKYILDSWRADAAAALRAGPVATAHTLARMPGPEVDLPRAALFGQAALFMHDLSERIGEANFVKVERLLLGQAGGKFLLSQANVMDLFTKVSGQDCRAFFEAHAWRTRIPGK